MINHDVIDSLVLVLICTIFCLLARLCLIIPSQKKTNEKVMKCNEKKKRNEKKIKFDENFYNENFIFFLFIFNFEFL